MLKFSKETLMRAKYEKRGPNRYKAKFSVTDDFFREPEANLLGIVRGRLDSRTFCDIYNRANVTESSSNSIGDSGSYDYFQPTMPNLPDKDL